MHTEREWNWSSNDTDPWRREHRITMTLTHLVIIVFLTFVIGWVVGQMTPQVDAPATKDKAVDVHVTNAQNYADWCGGYVQTIGTDRTVVGCDR